ncbi:coiled-coil protein [[Eubacterium] cellulosolvens]
MERARRMVETLPNSSQKIEDLMKQNTEYRNQRNSIVKNLEEYVRKRDKSNEEFQKRKILIQQLKEKRDALNIRVQEYKKERNNTRELIAKKRKESEALQQELEKLKGQFPGKYEETKNEIKKLEWQIQTEPVSLSQERALVSKIANLEAGIAIQKRRYDLREKIRRIRNEIKDLSDKAAQFHTKLEEIVAESENYHNQMLNLVNEATLYKEEADKAHQNFVNAKNEANDLQQHILLISAQIKGVKKSVNETAKREQLEKEQEIKKKIEDSATGKLKKGERLSFDEFKILIEKGAI